MNPLSNRISLPAPSGPRSKYSAVYQKDAASSRSKASSSHQSVFEKHQPQRTHSETRITIGRTALSSRSYSRHWLDISRLPSRTDSEIVAGMHKYTDWREYRRALNNYEMRQDERSTAFNNGEITLEEYQLFSASDQKPTYVGHAKIDEEAAFRRIFGF
jgi:hypothetical protein